MTTEQRLQRISELMSLIDSMLATDLISADMDVNEMMGAHDGAMTVLRESWDELKALLVGNSSGEMLQ